MVRVPAWSTNLWPGNGCELGIAGATALVIVLVGVALRRAARKQHARFACTERTEILEVPLLVASKTSLLFVVVVAIYVGLSTLDVPQRLDRAAISALTIAGFLQTGVWGSTALVALLAHKRKAALASDRAAVGSLAIIGVVLRAVLWMLVLLLILDNIGVDVTAIVAGLGVGGIAVALAVQNVLGDLLASLSITLDRPFVVGDFLIVGDFMGSVENIGIKSVRLRSLSGEQIVISNADLLGSRVRNYGRMLERRVVITIGVTYETPRALLETIPQTIKAIVEAQTMTRFDRSHFAKYGDFSLDFETVYYVLSADYNQHMDIQQRIYFAIHEAFERDSIEFAYPTQKLWLSPTGVSRAQSEPA
jgi:small-conductance mechanosensitive channel